LVRDYETRADEISRQLDEIDVEELKEYVLVSHYRAGSRPLSSMNEADDPSASADLKELDDYTAVVTATILQALPYLSRLGRLLDTWTVRLIILRSAPGFIRDLKRARTSLDQGWAKIAMSPGSIQTTNSVTFERSTMLELRYVIEQQVGSLGRRLDRFLDDLEGRDDMVPDSWIDDFELLESAYSAWVVQAERKVQEMEWREQKAQSGLASIREIESPVIVFKPEAEDTSLVETPVLNDSSLQTTAPTISVHEAMQTLAGPLNSNPPDLASENERARNAPTDPITSIPAMTSQESNGSVRTYSSTRESSPSVLEQSYGISRRSSERSSRNITPTSSAASKLDIPDQTVKKRAAFLNDIERTNSLKQSKSPVRPFEHASNAFTRLFKKERAAEVLRPIRRPLNVRSVSDGTEDGDGSPGSATLSPVADVANKFNAMYLENLNATIGSQRTPKDEISNPLSRSVSNRSTSLSRENSPAPLAEKPRENAIGVAIAEPPTAARAVTEVRPSVDSSPGKEDFPSNWPLAADVQNEPSTAATRSHQDSAKTDLRLSRVPMPTDAFDRVIIQDMPGDKTHEAEDVAFINEAMPLGEHHYFVPADEQQASTPDPLRPDDDESLWHTTPVRPPSRTRTNSGHSARSNVSNAQRMRSGEQSDLSDSAANGTQHSSRTASLASAAISPPQPSPRPVSTVVEDEAEDEADDDSDGAPSSPIEIVDVQSVSYLHVSPSKGNHKLRPPSVEPVISAQRSLSDPAVSPQVARLEPPAFLEKLEIATSNTEGPALVKRASVASIEAFSRGDVRSVDVSKLSRRSSTSSPLASPPETPIVARSPPDQLGGRTYFTSQAAGNAEPELPSLPMQDVTGLLPLSRSSSREVTHGIMFNAAPVRDEESSPTTSQHTPGPLNAVMTKRQGKGIISDENLRPTAIQTYVPKHSSSVEDSFDRHVSEVLERLPSGIKFKPRPGAETPVSRSNETRMYPASRQKGARTPSRASNMTIVPAEQSPKKPSSATEPVVKLYHLTQAGREEPIKLYVRLVGENERVMVRVGGGWADLAEYLRQYAEHHGSRTVSDGNAIEVLQTVNGASGQRKLSGSTARSPYSPSPVSTPNRPTSKDGPQSRLNATGTGGDWSSDETRVDETAATAATSTPATMHITPHRNAMTPTFITPRGSRPSTADAQHAALTAATRPSSRLSNNDSPNVPYGSGRKTEISSEHKAKWVEGMLERAKRAGGGGGGGSVAIEKSSMSQDDDAQAAAASAGRDRERYFGELGKAGTTRRVIFRSASASSGSVPPATAAAATAAAVAAANGAGNKAK
jgi:hypothetical protein